VGANAVATFLGLPPGSHTVFLSGVPSNCSVSGANPRSVSLIAGVVAATTFSVGCSALPTTGSLTVTTATSGASGDLDSDGPTLPVARTSCIATNAVATFLGLALATGSVSLSWVGSASTVSVTSPNTRSVTVAAVSTTPIAVAISCPPTAGSLSVTTSTSG